VGCPSRQPLPRVLTLAYTLPFKLLNFNIDRNAKVRMARAAARGLFPRHLCRSSFA
jgi:hypothetical protein